MKKIVFGWMLTALIATPALATHCPSDMKAVDEAMAKVTLPAADTTKVKALRAKGEELHKAGKHDESIKVLADALKILGTQHKH